MVGDFNIGRHKIGNDRCFVIAEAGVNHNGDISLALKLVDVAADAGADAVKFQTYSVARLVGKDAQKAAYQKQATDPDESQYAMLKKLELSADDHCVLKRRCEERDIIFLSSPFDEISADLLESLDVAAFKIPSGEIVNIPYLVHIAKKQRPIILSTGMATLVEVDTAVDAIRSQGNEALVVLHCISNYPADAKEANLRAMATIADHCKVAVGFSDHTEGIEIPIAAAALGARVIEKHFTLDRTLPGPDHRASIEPGELRSMVRALRRVEVALGDGQKRVMPGELESRAIARKSLVAAHDLDAETVLRTEDVTAKRPGTGLSPALLPSLVGRRLRVAVRSGQQLSLEQFG